MRSGKLVFVRWAPVAMIVAALTAVGGCSKEPAPARKLSPEVREIYVRLHELRQDYERGLELVLSGEALRGKNLLEATTSRLRAAAANCARVAGCDARIFTESLEQVRIDRAGQMARRATWQIPAGPGSGSTEIGPSLGEAAVERARAVEEQIRLSEPVMDAINDWLTWNRPEFLEAYENYAFMRSQIAPIWMESGLPEALLFGIMAKETGGKVHAYSRAGAAGPLQFMRHTARRYGLGSDDGFDLRLDPRAATRASAAYVSDQLETFDGDLELTLAAYNGGETRLRRLYRRYRKAKFRDPQIHLALPRETRDYVPQVLAAAWLFLHADEYGLRLADFDGTTAQIVLEAPLSLGELSICLGQRENPRGWFRTLRNLNPRARTSERVPAGGQVTLPARIVAVYTEQCVADAPLLRLARQLHAAAHPGHPALGPVAADTGSRADLR